MGYVMDFLKVRVMRAANGFCVIPNISLNLERWAQGNPLTLYDLGGNTSDPRAPVREYISTVNQHILGLRKLLLSNPLSLGGPKKKTLDKSWREFQQNWIEQSLHVQKQYGVRVDAEDPEGQYSHHASNESLLLETRDYVLQGLAPFFTVFPNRDVVEFFLQKEEWSGDYILDYGVEIQEGAAKFNSHNDALRLLKEYVDTTPLGHSDAVRKRVQRTLTEYKEYLKNNYSSGARSLVRELPEDWEFILHARE